MNIFKQLSNKIIKWQIRIIEIKFKLEMDRIKLRMKKHELKNK
jgi:hypothetical protein